MTCFHLYFRVHLMDPTQRNQSYDGIMQHEDALIIFLSSEDRLYEHLTR